jgi:hypothetical protein
MRNLIPMPSPNRSNKARAYIVPMKIDRRTALALDQRNDTFAATRADLPDLAKRRETGEDDENGDPRELLARLLRQQGAGDQEVAGMLARLEGHGAVGKQGKGEGISLDDQVENLSRFLRGKGMSEDDIRTACDLGIGGQSGTRFGGVFGGNMGGNLRGQVSQPSVSPTDPAARDRDFLISEEALGNCAYAGGGRDSRRVGRDSRMSFDQVYGLLPTIEKVEAQRSRRRSRSEKALGMDARSVDSFNARFPNAARIKPAY